MPTKKRLYDSGLGFVLGICLMGLIVLGQSQQSKNWEQLYADQEFEVKVHRDYATVKSRLVCQLSGVVREQASKIAELNAQLEQLRSKVPAPAVNDRTN